MLDLVAYPARALAAARPSQCSGTSDTQEFATVHVSEVNGMVLVRLRRLSIAVPP